MPKQFERELPVTKLTMLHRLRALNKKNQIKYQNYAIGSKVMTISVTEWVNYALIEVELHWEQSLRSLTLRLVMHT